MSVVHMHAVRPRSITDRNEEARAFLAQARLRAYTFDAHDLAAKAEVTASTIYAFRSGRTTWPRPKTLFSVLEAMGYELQIVEK